MLVGAFAAIVGSYFTHSALGGVAAAMAGAVAFSLVLAYGATIFRGDPVVIGIGMNLLASGLTAYLLRVVIRGQRHLQRSGHRRSRADRDPSAHRRAGPWLGLRPAVGVDVGRLGADGAGQRRICSRRPWA